MRACKNCRYGDHVRAADGADIYYCRLLPPRPDVVKDDLVWVQPPMKPAGWCGQFKLAFFRWLGNFGRRGT
jgi:hypothetical protein